MDNAKPSTEPSSFAFVSNQAQRLQQAHSTTDAHAIPMSSMQAFEQFSRVAEQQTRSIQPKSRAMNILKSSQRRVQNVLKKNLGVDNARSNQWAIALTIGLSIIIFGSISALDIYCLVLGVRYKGEKCEKDLSAWLIVKGIFGLLSTALTLAVVGTRRKSRPDSSAPAGMQEIQPGSAARLARDKRLLSGFLGLSQLFIAIWFAVGLDMIASIDRSNIPLWGGESSNVNGTGSYNPQTSACHPAIYWFTFGYVVATWVVFGFVVLLSICCCIFAPNETMDDEQQGIDDGDIT